MKVKLKMSSGLGRYDEVVEIEDDTLAKTLIAQGTAQAVNAPAPPAPPSPGSSVPSALTKEA